jgi:hypothetical protein
VYLIFPSLMVYELDITLEDVAPAIWRRVQVPAEITMAELHHVIQIAMGWTDAHFHQYLVAGEVIGVPDPDGDPVAGTPLTDETTVRLVDVALANTTLRYEYDFGDRWQHRIVVGRVLPHDAKVAVCVDGARACPPEDCGGAGGYGELLDILADPSHVDHDARLAAVDGALDPEAFDRERVNALFVLRSTLPRHAPAPASRLLH